MKYIKKYNEELNAKKALIGTSIAAGLMAGSCKKDDIIPNKTSVEVAKDSTEVSDVEDSSVKSLNKVSDIVNKISDIEGKKPEVKKESKPKKKVHKFKDFLKSKFKKRNHS